jgi:hypothetical protein
MMIVSTNTLLEAGGRVRIRRKARRGQFPCLVMPILAALAFAHVLPAEADWVGRAIDLMGTRVCSWLRQ